MDIKHFEIDIPEENPFANCKLGRQKYADILTNIVDSYSKGFVLAINNKWGTGKTTFIKMWEQDLKKKGHKTVYFNAWENDFEDNPLTALMGELNTLTEKSTKLKFKSTLKKAVTLSKHIPAIIAHALANKYIDTKSVKEAIVEITKGLSDVFENEVNEYAEKKKSISEFKKSLSDFIANTNEKKPLIFIIDELDRCRPNYAVSILEQIKHFFSVPDIVYVLSIDKIQLGNAVKGVYGSEFIDSEEYLSRFIDLEYSIPEPDSDVFYKYLFDYYEFKKFFDSTERKQYPEVKFDSKLFLQISKSLFTNRNISLRKQEKIFGLARIALRSVNLNDYVVAHINLSVAFIIVIPHIFLFLAFIKITNSEFYQNLKNKKLTLSQVQEKYLRTVIENKNDHTEHYLIWLEAHLINLYNNSLESRPNQKKLYEHDEETRANKLLIDSIINKKRNSYFLDTLESIDIPSLEKNLDHFLTRLELLEDLKI